MPAYILPENSLPELPERFVPSGVQKASLTASRQYMNRKDMTDEITLLQQKGCLCVRMKLVWTTCLAWLTVCGGHSVF